MNPGIVIRRAQQALDHLHKSHTTLIRSDIRYGEETRTQLDDQADLAGRTDEDGNLTPYAQDDPAVLRKLFHIDEDDWKSLR